MAILNLSYVHPIVATPNYKGASFTVPAGYWNRYKYEKVEYKISKWLRMLYFIKNKNNRASAQEIRDYMGWGPNNQRSHCDYFNTLLHDRLISRVKINGVTKPQYRLTAKGLRIHNEAIAKIPEYMKKARLAGTKRQTKFEYEEKRNKRLAKRSVKELKSEIHEEAANAFLPL